MTKSQRSLPTSITYVVLGLAFSITLIYSLLVLVYSWVIEDNIFNRLVATEAAYISDVHRQTGQAPVPRSGFMTLYRDWQGVPDEVIKGYELKSSQIEYELETGNTVHIHVFILGDTEYVLMANVAGYEVSRDFLPNVLVWLVVFALASCLLVSLIAFFVAKRITYPIKQLAEQVKELSAENPQSGFSQAYPTNEVKVLASTIENSFSQLQQALKREVNFTRDVSHEIRTPISVLKNVIDRNVDSASLSEQEFQQVSRACFDLEKITETLLALARNESSHITPLNMAELIENAVLQHFELNHTAKGKALELQLDLEDGVFQTVNQNLAQLLLNNVLSNIVQYASGGEVLITLTAQAMSFSNHTTDFTPEQPEKTGVRGASSKGIGQGLSLIMRICEQSSWQMQTSNENGWFTIRILF